MKYKLLYGVCQLHKNKILTLITMIMMTLSFVVIEYAGMVYLTYNYSKYKAKNVIAFSYDDIYNVNLQKYATGFCSYEDVDMLIEFYHGLSKVDGIKHVGMFYENTDYGDNTLYVSEDLLPLCGIEEEFVMVEGMSSIIGEEMGGVYPVGTKTKDNHSGYEIDIISMVSGKKYISSDFFCSAGKILDLDDYIIISFDDLIALDKLYFVNALNNLFYIVEEDADKEKICQDVYNLADELGIDIYGINDVNTLFDNMSKDAYDKAGEKYFMPLVLCLCAIISMVASAYISILKNSHDMAVMLSNNMTRRDIMAIVYIEVNIKILTSFIVSIVFWSIKYIDFDVQTKEMFLMLIPSYFLAMFLMDIVICLILKGFVNKQTPMTMLGEIL